MKIHLIKSARSILFLLFLGLITCLSGCATSSKPVRFEPNVRLSPASFGQTTAIYQQIHAELNGQSRDMNVVLEIAPEKLTMVGMAMERRMMTVTYDGEKLETWKDERLPDQISPEIVLTNLQLTLWPKDAIAHQLPVGWTITETDHKRDICFNNATTIHIEYSQPKRWLGTIKMTDYRYRYSLSIQSVPLS